MMTDERLKYFLNKETIPNDAYSELVNNYFTKDWYQQNRDDKHWDEGKVKQFWKLIRMHTMPRGKKKQLYDFERFKFPPFTIDKEPIESFWESEEKKQFEFEVSFWGERFFWNSKFLGSGFFKKDSIKSNIFL